MNFFAFCLEFSIPGQVGIDWNDNFYFLSFSTYANLFWLEKKSYWCFLIVWIFLLFLEFFITGRVGTDRTILFIFSLYRPFPTCFDLKWSHNGVFYFFFYFFGILYSGLGRNWSERYFLFSLFLGLSQTVLAWKEAVMIFLNFLNFFAIFFWNSLFQVGQELIEW